MGSPFQEDGRHLRILRRILVALCFMPSFLHGETIIQWDFEDSLDATTPHAALEPLKSQPAAAPSVLYEEVETPRGTIQAAHFSRGTIFRARPGLSPNGGG